MRLPDWEARLNAHVRAWRAMAGSYGPVPCARFAAGGVEAVTGIDHYAPFRGRYSTELGAAKALRQIGEDTLEATFGKHLPDRSLSHVQRGDIVFDGTAVGIAMGSHALFAGEEERGEGLVRVDRSAWFRAWAVD